jgi:hypothetical protein
VFDTMKKMISRNDFFMSYSDQLLSTTSLCEEREFHKIFVLLRIQIDSRNDQKRHRQSKLHSYANMTRPSLRLMLNMWLTLGWLSLF